ncbi:peptidase S51, dipeptidase E [candidate division TM7 genomosp. GTL1]|nr:peptidase S51, dipeptidase E [candidate division TM7 genomosp. GTL1]
MKLFLSSLTISKTQAPHFIKLVGKEAQDIKLALIENAVDSYGEPKDWVIQNREAIQSHGFAVELLDLNDYRNSKEALHDKLASLDAIWLGGGNVYYLRWLLQETGADELIKDLVGQGLVYSGGSAGAIIAGPTLKYFETADDPNDAPEVIMDGLYLTDTVVVPHMDNEKFAKVIHNINENLKRVGHKTVPLTDAQALVIDGDTQEIV